MSDRSSSIRVNGQIEPLLADLPTLLREKEIAPDARGVAVAVNGTVVPRAEWSSTRLSPGDQIEIVRARQGG
jgi:sulfur carrier protein